jgi:hypothetical protein
MEIKCPDDKLATIVSDLRRILTWLDSHEHIHAAIHINGAIERLSPTPAHLVSDGTDG